MYKKRMLKSLRTDRTGTNVLAVFTRSEASGLRFNMCSVISWNLKSPVSRYRPSLKYNSLGSCIRQYLALSGIALNCMSRLTADSFMTSCPTCMYMYERMFVRTSDNKQERTWAQRFVFSLFYTCTISRSPQHNAAEFEPKHMPIRKYLPREMYS